MLRLAIAAAVVVMSSPALAQPIDEVKDLKFGAGCIGPVSTFAARLGTCLIEGSKSRVWCPNGKIFDRSGQFLQSSHVVRAMCNLNQVL